MLLADEAPVMWKKSATWRRGTTITWPAASELLS
jgi:hypothetical protein